MKSPPRIKGTPIKPITQKTLIIVGRFPIRELGVVELLICCSIVFSLKINLLICYRKWTRLPINLFVLRIKKFSSPKIKIWFEPMFFYGFFCGLIVTHSRQFPSIRLLLAGIEPASSPSHRTMSLHTLSLAVYLSLHERYSFRIVLATLRAIYSNFSIPARSQADGSVRPYSFHSLSLAGIEPAPLPSEGSILSIRLQGR